MLKSSNQNILLTRWDMIFYFFVLIFCFFSFNHPDILHTGGASITYLNGHILDFYEINQKALGTANYLASTYILFALWNIPIRLLNIVTEPTFNVGNVIFWYKLLPTIFLFSSAYYIYKIGHLIKLTKNDSYLMAAFWLSSPILFFSQFIFGQYDSLTVFFVLIGLYYYLQRKIGLFVFFFAISLTFKYFPLFIFIPLLLLVEKRIWKIALLGILVLLPIGLEVVPYLHSDVFKQGIFGFEAARRVGKGAGRVFDLLWLIICAFAYWKQVKGNDQFIRWALYIPMAVTSLLFSLIDWHPQWLLMVTPFIAITTFINKKAKFFILLDIMMMFFFVAQTVHHWSGGVDQVLWQLGIFGHVNPHISDVYARITMNQFFPTVSGKMYNQLLILCFFINIILKMPLNRFAAWGNDIVLLPIREHWNFVRVRFFVGVAIFIVPAAICLLAR